jgi:hypothetical protein
MAKKKKKRKSPRKRVRFKDDNDCPKALRPTTRDRSKKKFCLDVGKGYTYYRTNKYYGCCKKSPKKSSKKSSKKSPKKLSQCAGTTSEGKRCKRKVTTKYCYQH